MIHNITYHVLVKEQGSTENVSISLNPNVLPIDSSTDKLLEQLMERYRGKAGKGYGIFEINTDSYPTSKIISEYLTLKNEEDFQVCTERLMEHLMAESKGHAGAKGGKVVFIHYTENNSEHFLVAILTEKVGLMAKNWNLTQDDILNFENLRFAGRVDINSWHNYKTDEQRYVSFLKGQGEVSGYFKRFMGCSDVLMASQHTKSLVEQIKNFATVQNLTSDERAELNADAKSYLQDLSDENEQFSLEAFANRIWSDKPQDLIDTFESYGEKNNCCLSDGFVPDKRSLRKLVVQSYRTKHWAFSFDDEAIKNNAVQVLNGKVIFHSPPQDILDAYNENN